MTPVATGHLSIRRVPLDLARRRLGPTALQVLRTLWTWRDKETGVCTVARKRLAKRAGVSWQAAARALALLAEAKLVVNLGWRAIPTGGAEPLMVYARRVYGAEVKGDRLRDGFFLVCPEPAGSWITSATTDRRRGGGEGRGGAPKENANWAGDGEKSREVLAYRRLVRRLEALRESWRLGLAWPVDRDDKNLAPEPPRRTPKSRQAIPPKQTTDRVDPNYGSGHILDLSKYSSSFSFQEKEAAVPAALICSLGSSEVTPAGPPAEEVRSDDDGGLRLGSSDAPRTSPRRSRKYVRAALGARIPNLPRFPQLKSATIPHPPRLSPDASTELAAREIARAYAGAYEASTGKPCWAARRPERTKNWALLLAAAEFIRDADVPPAAWVAWSFDVWAKKTGRPPPISWVFSVRRLGDRFDWFSHDHYDEIGGTIVAGPKEKGMFQRYTALLEAIDREGAHVDAAPLVARYFPEGWDAAVAAVEREIRQTRERLETQLADGAWLWGRGSCR